MTSDTVHIVLGYVNYEDTDVVGVFNDDKPAEEAKEQYEKAIEENDREKAPLSKHGRDLDFTGELHYDGFYIEEWSVETGESDA